MLLPGLELNYKLAEVTFWDLPGQEDYLPSNQILMRDAALALLVIDFSDPQKTFQNVSRWSRLLNAKIPQVAKLLVSARSDVSRVTAGKQEIDRMLRQHRFSAHITTSAKADSDSKFDSFIRSMLYYISWNTLPCIVGGSILKQLRRFFVERKSSGETLVTMDILIYEFQRGATGMPPISQINLGISYLQSRGEVYRLQPTPKLVVILLEPELINEYAASILRAAREQGDAPCAIHERDIVSRDLPLASPNRLRSDEEKLLLESMAELLIECGLCQRRKGFLVFSSMFLPMYTGPQVHVDVKLIVVADAREILTYVTFNLSDTGHFRLLRQWANLSVFERSSNRVYIRADQISQETSELEIGFEYSVEQAMRYNLIDRVTGYLKRRQIRVERRIPHYCPACGEKVKDEAAVISRETAGASDILCQFCGTSIPLISSLEQLYDLGTNEIMVKPDSEKRTIVMPVSRRGDVDSTSRMIYILHLSDLHMQDEDVANVYRTQLETDLIRELDIRRLQCLVISGGVAHLATAEEYCVAFEMVDSLVERFGLDASRVVIVPGNHDVNWPLSKKAYPFVYRDDLPCPLTEENHIPAGDAGALVCDKDLYQKRFAPFSDHFYRRVYSGQDYPLDEADQALLVEKPEDRILFLGLNSCWQLDHHFRERASINMPALTRALDHLQEEAYDGWLKIAVWHHSVTGVQKMNDDDFIELLSVSGFQICLHGHIHEAIEDFYKYDNRHGLHIVGAGTFGAPAHEQVTGIPLQYNLLRFDPDRSEITVHTRKKEKPNGTWSADARWGDKNNPMAWYKIQLKP